MVLEKGQIMKLNLPGLSLLITLGAVPALAQCPLSELAEKQLVFSASPPAAIDMSLRPVVPTCLQGLAEPSQENCPRDELLAYGAAIEAWAAALNEFVTETNRYANQVTVFANSAVGFAREARRHADAALGFAECEAAEISASSN